MTAILHKALTVSAEDGALDHLRTGECPKS